MGFGSGGTPTSFLPFGLTSAQRGAAFADHLHLIHSAWRGDTLSHPDNPCLLYTTDAADDG
ncbi:hypothetical protein QM325_25020, partial [Pseudomonas putida]|nr:hypothetical protein [Pseudomonas putida]